MSQPNFGWLNSFKCKLINLDLSVKKTGRSPNRFPRGEAVRNTALRNRFSD